MKNTLFERLLEYYQIDKEQYEKLIAPVSIDSFSDGHSFKGMDNAVKLVKKSIQDKDKIFIYGDYDADGIMSTSIVARSILLLGVIPSYYIPNRYLDGYGITLEKAQKIVEQKFNLVITVDNGISAFEAIEYLKEHGVKVLIIDHHQVQEAVPPADAILHPQYSEFGETPSSAGFVSFMFSWALLGYFNKYLSIMAAISLISDMMPLVSYNRDFLRLVFSSYKDGEFYQIDLLKEGQSFDETAIGLKIAPKINALGRLIDDTSINNIVKFFVNTDREKTAKLLNWIVETNEQRKLESKFAAENMPKVNEKESAIIVKTDSKEGLLGLIANQICSIYHKPTIVFTEERDGDVLKGSCRAPEGFNVVDAFNYCKDIIITSGGHALAGGCSIKKEDFDSFKNKFIEYSDNNPVQVVLHDYVQLGLNEINEENYDIIQSFSPFGEGWRSPEFIMKHIKTDSLMFSKTGEHILTYVGQGVKLVGFGFAKNDVQECKYVDLVGKIKKTSYKGQTSLEYSIKDVLES